MARPVRPERPAELDDVTLALARRGDGRARRALVVRYQGPVFALLGRMLCRIGQGQQVEDLAQETFLRVFQALPRFRSDGEARLSSWILTIATRLAIDLLRRRRNIVEVDATTVTLPARGATDGPAHHRQLAAALRDAVAELAPPYRAAFLLREYHELSYEEIAAALQIDVGTVKSRLSRARVALRATLRDGGFHG